MKKSEITRTHFLVSIYGATKGSSNKFVDMWNVGALLGLERSVTRDVVEYLVAEGLLEYVALGGILRLTHQGIKEVEEAHADTSKPTAHLVPLTVINIQNAPGSQIVGSGSLSGSHISSSDSRTSFDAEQLQYILEHIEQILHDATLKEKSSMLNAISKMKDLLADPSTPVPKLKAEIRILRASLRDSGLSQTSILEELEEILESS